MTSPNIGLQNQRILPYLTEVEWDISDRPFVPNKDPLPF